MIWNKIISRNKAISKNFIEFSNSCGRFGIWLHLMSSLYTFDDVPIFSDFSLSNALPPCERPIEICTQEGEGGNLIIDSCRRILIKCLSSAADCAKSAYHVVSTLEKERLTPPNSQTTLLSRSSTLISHQYFL